MARQFTCPKCGAHVWGSRQEADGTLRRYCHGYVELPACGQQGCRFSWPESDDARYGVEPIFARTP